MCSQLLSQRLRAVWGLLTRGAIPGEAGLPFRSAWSPARSHGARTPVSGFLERRAPRDVGQDWIFQTQHFWR